MNTRTRSDAAASRTEADCLLDKPHIWCPGLDDEMQTMGEKYCRGFDLFDEVLDGGCGKLGEFKPTAKLYILCHGHGEMPLFKTDKGKWTATQLAELLEADGLPKDQREIELLVCHAGESVNSRKGGAKMMALSEKYSRATKAGRKADVDRCLAEYKKLQPTNTAPSFFENDPERLLVPMAAQLTQKLKDRSFTNFRITSYKCAVAQYAPDNHVYLDLTAKGGQWGVSADRNAAYRVVWQ